MPANLVKSIQKVETFLLGFDDWFFKKREFAYPQYNKYQLLQKDALSVTLDANGAYAAQTPFLISIISKPIPAIDFEDPSNDDVVGDETEDIQPDKKNESAKEPPKEDEGEHDVNPAQDER